ncbi:MAG TPA: ATP-dependent helicase, partial [Candidatus Omnitrophota bacterium]|nr:ATP-dependent helicase [Candidatus Omnitrophota bacterium]
LKIILNPLDEISWTRALTLQPGIGTGYAVKIFDHVEKEGGDLKKVLLPNFGDKLAPRVREGLFQFKKTLKNLLRDGSLDHPDALLEQVLESGYNKYVLMNFENAQDRLQDLRELVNFAHTYKTLKEFLADTSLREGFKGETLLTPGAGEDDPREDVVLSTIHQAKGLEWKAVFVIGLSEGQFPHAKSMENENELEEERRLFYVASTRAKEELILIHPMTRYDYNAGMVINRPSPFVLELPSRVYDEVEVEENQEEEETIYLDE